MAQIMVRREGHAQMVDAEYLKQIEEAHKDLHNLLSHDKQFAPIVLRMAFHDAATYDAKTKNGGPNGSIRNELNTPPNKGIEKGVVFVEPVKTRHPKVTYADLYQLAGIVAIEVTGGPKICFVPGRKDVLQQQDKGSVPNPNGDAQHLRDVFHRMGLSDKDIVVLSGAHALGRAHKDRSGFDGPFTRDPLKFDNSYFVELIKGDTPGLVKFPTDKSLLTDRVFRPLVERYAKDQKAFFRDYAASHKKLSELGFHPNVPHSNSHTHPQTQTHSHSHPHQHPHSNSHQHLARPHSNHCSQPQPPSCGFA